MRIAICINAAWNVLNFRAGLVCALIADGHEVIAIVPADASVPKLRALGVRVIETPMSSRTASVVKDIGLAARLFATLRRERPDVYLGYTIKPNTYGSAAAALLGIPVINNISGLGTAFISTSWLTYVARALYRIGLARSETVFFQNEDDRALFVGQRLVTADRTAILPGSGIDLAAFDPQAFPVERDGTIRFLMIARMVRDKGVLEYVAAARLVLARFPEVRFELLGFLDVDNRTAIARETVDGWVAEGLVDYLGDTEDVRPFLARADCIVLPSYREGTSRVLIEAAAMARPAVTTDVAGCRDVVEAGVTGLLCAPRDADDLAARMIDMLELGATGRERMGHAARAMAERRYSERIVIERYRAAINAAVA